MRPSISNLRTLRNLTGRLGSSLNALDKTQRQTVSLHFQNARAMSTFVQHYPFVLTSRHFGNNKNIENTPTPRYVENQLNLLKSRNTIDPLYQYYKKELSINGMNKMQFQILRDNQIFRTFALTLPGAIISTFTSHLNQRFNDANLFAQIVNEEAGEEKNEPHVELMLASLNTFGEVFGLEPTTINQALTSHLIMEETAEFVKTRMDLFKNAVITMSNELIDGTTSNTSYIPIAANTFMHESQAESMMYLLEDITNLFFTIFNTPKTKNRYKILFSSQ